MHLDLTCRYTKIQKYCVWESGVFILNFPFFEEIHTFILIYQPDYALGICYFH